MVHGRGYFENIIFNHKGIYSNKIKERATEPCKYGKSSILGMSTLESGADNTCQSLGLKDGRKSCIDAAPREVGPRAISFLVCRVIWQPMPRSHQTL